jgi:hypothetical protein
MKIHLVTLIACGMANMSPHAGAADGLPSLTAKVEKIDLPSIARVLPLKERRKFESGVFVYSFNIPDTTKKATIARLEAWGYYPNDLNKVVVGCHRFNIDGSGPKLEDIGTPCGKVYADVLSVFVLNSIDVANYLMACAKAKGKELSSCAVSAGDFSFEYGNDSVLIVRRQSRTTRSL